MGGRFAMSDDSHDVGQIGTNYPRLLEYMQKAGIQEAYYADSDVVPTDTRFTAGFSRISVDNLVKLPFWNKVR
jgi:histidinol-phosphatase (PHP family)